MIKEPRGSGAGRETIQKLCNLFGCECKMYRHDRNESVEKVVKLVFSVLPDEEDGVELVENMKEGDGEKWEEYQNAQEEAELDMDEGDEAEESEEGRKQVMLLCEEDHVGLIKPDKRGKFTLLDLVKCNRCSELFLSSGLSRHQAGCTFCSVCRSFYFTDPNPAKRKKHVCREQRMNFLRGEKA